MPKVAPSACVEPKAQLAEDVVVGPGCYVGPDVTLGPGCELLPNVTLMGHTDIGSECTFFPGCVIGCFPQDLKYRGTATRLVIGRKNVFREHVTVHPGTELGGGLTTIGDHCQFQIGTHIAHDCHVGNHCVVSNDVQIAGHCVIEDFVTISGLVGVQQFVTLGRYCFIAGGARCRNDVPPYMKMSIDGAVVGVNEEGMRRWKIEASDIETMWQLYRQVFSKKAEQGGKTISDRLASVESNGSLTEHARYLVDFMKRCIHDGRFGRYLESKRPVLERPPEFYERVTPMPGVPSNA